MFEFEQDGYISSGKGVCLCLLPYTLESTRTRPAHGSQASDGLVSTGEGDHPGILDVVDIFFFVVFFVGFCWFFLVFFHFLKKKTKSPRHTTGRRSLSL